jgi:hypothetical protein
MSKKSRKPLTWKDIKLVPTTSKDYAEEVVVTQSVENYPEWQKYACPAIRNSRSRSAFDAFCCAYGDNRKFLTKRLGKRQFVFRGEFFLSGWRLDLLGTQVIVLTAKGKGTCYETVIQDHGKDLSPDASRVIEFMELVGADKEAQPSIWILFDKDKPS